MNKEEKLIEEIKTELEHIEESEINDLDWYAKRLIDLVRGSDNVDLIMARSETEDVKLAASRLANALKDINNDLGEMSEVKSAIESVDYDIETYAGIAPPTNKGESK
jgi:hypothetical protein